MPKGPSRTKNTTRSKSTTCSEFATRSDLAIVTTNVRIPFPGLHRHFPSHRRVHSVVDGGGVEGKYLAKKHPARMVKLEKRKQKKKSRMFSK